MLKLVDVLVLVAAIQAAPDRRTDVNGNLRDRIEVYRQRMPHTMNKEYPFVSSLINNTFEGLEGDDLDHGNQLTSLTIVGLDDFVVNVLDFNLSRMELEFSVIFPQLNASGTYTLNATCCDGSGGPFSITLSNLNFTGTAIFHLEGDFVNLSEMFGVMSLESLKMNIEGIFHDQDLNTARIDYLRDSLMSVLKEDGYFHLLVSLIINRSLKPEINTGLNRLTLSGLIGRQAMLDAKRD